MPRTTHLQTLALALVMTFTLSSGAVSEETRCCKCQTMMPENVPGQAVPQTIPSPFKIRIKEESYDSDRPEIHVNLTATEGEMFSSFMLVAYTIGTLQDKVHIARGSFVLLNDDYEIKKDCYTGKDAFAVFSKEDKPAKNLQFIWKPSSNYGHIEFRASFVKNDQVFWVGEKSEVLYDSSLGGAPPKKPTFIPPINTDRCGIDKGCYRVPAGCSEPHCMYILTWWNDGQHMTMELGGLTSGAPDSYVAAAISDDIYVGDDVAFVCAHSLAHKTTEIYVGKHKDNYETTMELKYDEDKRGNRKMKNNYAFLVYEEGSHQNHRLLCRFEFKSGGNNQYPSFRGLKAHIVMSHGLADDGKPYSMGVGHHDYPHISESKVHFGEAVDASGRATYPLVKAHGCLMIVAWIFFSSIGFLLAKYYQPMWPEKRSFERKYWFMGHFQCMSMVFILVVIGVILIFVEADGYTKAPDLPYRAHPILGIIIFVCVFLLPFIALLRPGKGHDCRNVFNWLYWVFATIANVLAVPNIFIGMDFGKAMVPWWATWILVLWVIFHIVVEIILEVHGCMMHKKNKERRKKHELLKRDYPKQHHPRPEPAGRRFKRFMMILHFVVTFIVTLIMVIIIAVSS